MDFNTGPKHRPSRIPPRGGPIPHHTSHPRNMNAWHNNQVNTYQNQDDGMTGYQPAPMEYQNYMYPHNMQSPPEMIPANTQPAYPPFQGHWVGGHPPIYSPMEPMYQTTPPMSSNPTLPAVSAHLPPKKQLTDLQYKLKCSNCQHLNSLLEIEIMDKDKEIAHCHNQIKELQMKVQEMQNEIQRLRSVSEAGVYHALQPTENIVPPTKVSQLSPDAIEFNPIKTESVTSTAPILNEVPVVSAKGINDDSSSEAQADIEEPVLFAKLVKSEPLSEPSSPVTSESNSCPPTSASEAKPESVPDISNPVVKEETEETWPVLVEDQPLAQESKPMESSNNMPKVDDSEWEENESVQNMNSSESTSNSHQNNSNIRTRDQQPFDGRNVPFNRNNNRQKNFPGNFSGAGRGNKGNRRNDQETYNSRSVNRNTNEKGQFYQKPPNSRNFTRYSNDNSYGNRDEPRDHEYPRGEQKEFNQRGDGRGSRENLKEDKQRVGGYNNSSGPSGQHFGGRKDYHYKDKLMNKEERDNSYHKEEPTSYGRGRGGGFRSNEDLSARRGEGPRNDHRDQSNGGSWSSVGVSRRPKNIVKEIQEDLFNAPHDCSLAHCVAKDFRMGSGIAVKFKSEFKRVAELMDQGVEVGGCAYLEDKDNNNVVKRYIFYLVTKAISSGKPSYESLTKSLLDLKDKCRQFNVTKLALPHIGCGLDKLDWFRVKAMLNDIFQDIDIQITAYDFNADGLPEAEGNKPPPPRLSVSYQILKLQNIDPQTALVFLGTEDGHLDSTAERLNQRFNFAVEYKKSPKTVGKIWCFSKLTDYYVYSLIVSKTFKEKVQFADIENCCRELSKALRKLDFEYLGVEAFLDWSSDDVFTEKIVTLLRTSLPRPVRSLWVCYAEEKDDIHHMCKPRKNPTQSQM